MATTVDAFLGANPGYVGQAYRKPQTGPKKQTGKGGTATSAISETGAIIGGALGTLIPVPLVGTAIGAGAGGFLGRLLENKVRDNEYHLAEAGKEGALSAVLGAIPGGNAAKGGVKLSTVGTKAALRGAEKQGAKLVETEALENVGRLGKLGSSLRGYSRGISPGNRGISTIESKLQNQAVDSANKWGKGLTKGSQFSNVEKEITKLADKYGKTIEGKKIFSGDNALDVLTRFEKNVADNPSLAGKLTGQSKKVYNNLIDDVSKLEGKTNKDFVDIVSGKVNSRYKTVSSGGNAGSLESQIYEAMRDAMKGHIDEALPSRSGLNSQLSSLLGAKKNISKAITADSAAGQAQGLTIGRLASDIASPALDATGRSLQQTGKVLNSTLARQGNRQILGRALTGGSPGMETAEDTGDFTQPTMSPEMDPYSAPQQSYEPSVPQQTYTLEQAMNDISRDPKNTATYKWVYEQSQDSSGQLTAQEKKSQKQSQTALQGLNQLKTLYSQAGGGQNRLPGILGNVQGKVGANSKADSYNKIRDSLTTSLARAFGETGVLTDQDREVYKQALPRLEDTPEEAAIKLQYLEDMLAQSSYTDQGLGQYIGGM